MKATEQYFPAVLFILLYKVVLTFRVHEAVTTELSLTNSSYAVLFFMLFKVAISRV